MLHSMGPPVAPLPHVFGEWLEITIAAPPELGLRIVAEKNGTRDAILSALSQLIVDHFYGADVLAGLEFEKAAEIVRAALPTKKHMRSGDLGELLATEYVAWQTDFSVPVKKLRHKPDRDKPMFGNDIVGFQVTAGVVRVLKGEVKSKATLDAETVSGACTTLVNDDNRPKASTLAFMSRMLRRDGRDAEAELIERIQSTRIEFDRVVHLVFTVSGNDPEPFLRPHAGPREPINDRRLVGLLITDHQAFIDLVFLKADGGNS